MGLARTPDDSGNGGRAYTGLILCALLLCATAAFVVLSKRGPQNLFSEFPAPLSPPSGVSPPPSGVLPTTSGVLPPPSGVSPPPSSVLLNRGAVVIQVDTRKVVDDFNAALFHSLTAVINYVYAKRHGYSFVRIELGVDHCVHPLLGHNRLFGWTKVPFWWEATLDERYDWVVGLDSDAFIAEHAVPVHRYPSEFLLGQPYWGARPGDGAMLFLRDTAILDFVSEPSTAILDREPGNPDPDTYCSKRYANTGFGLIRSGPLGESFMRRWWDVNDLVRATTWSYDQDAIGVLWRAGGAVRGNFTVACSARHGVFKPSDSSQWVRHFIDGLGTPQVRTELVRKFAQLFGINASSYGQLVAEMRSVGALRAVDESGLSTIIQKMAERTKKASAAANTSAPFDFHCGGTQCEDEIKGPGFVSQRTPPFVFKAQP